MLNGGSSQDTHLVRYLILYALLAIVLCLPLAATLPVPRSSCYALDNSSFLYDFTDWIGHPFEYDGKGYVASGRFAALHDFVAGSGHVNFVQNFYNGDLRGCEYSFDKMGRTAQLNIICGGCLNGSCKGDLGCICNVAYDETKCRALVDLAIPCVRRGPRVFEGFTVGFNPRSWEVVYNGMTQMGFEKPHHQFSFGDEQVQVALYLTAISSLSGLVGKPTFQVNSSDGLLVRLSGSAARGEPPTTLSPSVLLVNWRCNSHGVRRYAVDISIPVEGYDPIEFTLTKTCECYGQGREDDAMKGWATFGIISCMYVVSAAST